MSNLAEQLSDLTRDINFYKKTNVMDVFFDTGHKIEVYVALDTASRTHGLRGISSLDSVDGMLFYFPMPTSTPFTMNGMSMDLDIAWFNEKGKLLQHGTYAVDHQYPITCDAEFSYVLECRANSFHGNANLNISDGEPDG